MRADIPKKNVKYFTQALLCLSKIGSDLVFDTKQDRCVLRTLSLSQSAYACIYFHTETFFEKYTHSKIHFKCKVNIKNCITTLRSLKSVDHICFQLNSEESILVLEFVSPKGITSLFCFSFEDQSNILQADFGRTNCQNLVAADAKLLNHTVSYFHLSLDEITICAKNDGLTLSSYIDDQNNSPNGTEDTLLHTECTIPLNELEIFHVTNQVDELTFCLREFKAILSFCQSVEQPVHLYFHQGGKPILLTNSHDGSGPFVLELVIATINSPTITNNHHHKYPSTSSENTNIPPTLQNTPTQQIYQQINNTPTQKFHSIDDGHSPEPPFKKAHIYPNNSVNIDQTAEMVSMMMETVKHEDDEF